MLKKILLAVVFISFLLGGFCFVETCLAQGRTLEITYPQLGVQDVQQPTTTKAFLPAYIEYIFTWAIYIAGLLAFFALVYGGILYMTSAGNPSATSNAKDQIFAGFLGLIILLSSFLILKTIDPQLVTLEQVKFEPAISGIKIYSMDDLPGCLESEDEPSLLISSSIPELFKESSILGRTILDWGAGGKYKIESIEFLTNPDELTIEFYSENEYLKEYLITTYDNYKKGDCITYTLGTQPKSIKLDYHIPGVYLCANDDCNIQDCKVYNNSSATLPEFDDKTKSVKFVYGKDDDGKHQAKYAAILHEHENFMGKAVLADGEENKCIKLNELEKLNDKSGKGVNLDGIIKGVSSITVYQKPIEEIIDEIGFDDGVAFYEDKNHEGCRLPRNKDKDKDEFYQNYAVADLDKGYEMCGDYDWNIDECKGKETCEDKFSSLEMRGNYIALLFEHSNYKGDCEVFTKRDSYFRDNRIGQCGFLGRKDCLTSFIIRARK